MVRLGHPNQIRLAGYAKLDLGLDEVCQHWLVRFKDFFVARAVAQNLGRDRPQSIALFNRVPHRFASTWDTVFNKGKPLTLPTAEITFSFISSLTASPENLTVSPSKVISMPVASRPSSLISSGNVPPSGAGSSPQPNNFLPLPLIKLHKPIENLPF